MWLEFEIKSTKSTCLKHVRFIFVSEKPKQKKSYCTISKIASIDGHMYSVLSNDVLMIMFEALP